MKEFEHIKKVSSVAKNGNEYERHFWKLKSGDRDIATFVAWNKNYNPKEIRGLQGTLDEDIIGFSFGGGCKKGEDPKYVFTFHGGSKKSFSFSELLDSFSGMDEDAKQSAIETVLKPPFVLGGRMYAKVADLDVREQPTKEKNSLFQD